MKKIRLYIKALDIHGDVFWLMVCWFIFGGLIYLAVTDLFDYGLGSDIYPVKLAIIVVALMSFALFLVTREAVKNIIRGIKNFKDEVARLRKEACVEAMDQYYAEHTREMLK